MKYTYKDRTKLVKEKEYKTLDDLLGNIAEYNEPLNFIIEFIAPNTKEIYNSFIIEEKLHKALTFNLKNSCIKADGEIVLGNFQYNDMEKSLRIEMENPSVENSSHIEITIATNITDLAAIIESGYVINNMAYIKIKGYEDVDGLITKSNIIYIKFGTIKIDIIAEAITKVVPAIDGERIVLGASFTTLDTSADYNIILKNNLGNHLVFEDTQSYASIDGHKIDLIEFKQDGNIVIVDFYNSHEIRNKKIDVQICAKMNNMNNIGDCLSNEFILCINNIDCSKDTIEIPLIRPITGITNTLRSDN